MRKVAMAAAAGAMSVVAPLSFAAEAAAGSGAPERTGGVSARDSGNGVTPAANCDIPMFGWVNCQVVKIRADDMVDVRLNDASATARVHCNLNELKTNDQLNQNTASMAIGERDFLWHNNTSGTVYADLRCSSPNWAGFSADVEAIAWE